jgi:hypothetical protein
VQLADAWAGREGDLVISTVPSGAPSTADIIRRGEERSGVLLMKIGPTLVVRMLSTNPSGSGIE